MALGFKGFDLMGVKDASINFPDRAGKRRTRTRSRDRNASKLDHTRQTLLNDESNIASQHNTLVTEGNKAYKDVAVPDQGSLSVTAKEKGFTKNKDFRD